MTVTVKSLLEAANAAVPRLSHAEAQALIDAGDAVVLDVREPAELEAGGAVAGAVHVPRGMLEFRADPATPYHDPRLDRSKAILLYCASGGRSALAGKLLQDMGYPRVFNLGAFKDWAEAGGAVDRPAAVPA